MAKRTLLVVSLSFLFGWGMPQVSGEDGRDFAGFYQLSNVIELGEVVSLTLSVRISNYSGTDLVAGAVVLTDPPSLEEYGYFSDVWIHYRDQLYLSGDFTIPIRVYEQWRQGATPFLYVDRGNHFHRPVELIQVPLGEVEP